MGDEEGSEVLAPFYSCEEPSAAAGLDFLRPAAACRRGKRRRLRGVCSHRPSNAAVWRAGVRFGRTGVRSEAGETRGFAGEFVGFPPAAGGPGIALLVLR
jgi:hypothetical protein